MHAFSDFANWLVPDKLLVGRYPYVEPSRCKTYEEGEKKLQQILKAGVTTFISLQVGEEGGRRLEVSTSAALWLWLCQGGGGGGGLCSQLLVAQHAVDSQQKAHGYRLHV